MNNSLKGILLGLASFGMTACATTSAPSAANTSSDAATSKSSFSLTDLTCWDMMTADEQDSAYVMMLVYGYAAGQTGQAEQTSANIAAASDKAETYCAANPDSAVIQAFK